MKPNLKIVIRLEQIKEDYITEGGKGKRKKEDTVEECGFLLYVWKKVLYINIFPSSKTLFLPLKFSEKQHRQLLFKTMVFSPPKNFVGGSQIHLKGTC